MTSDELQFIENADKRFNIAGEWVQYAIENRHTGKLIGDCAIKLMHMIPGWPGSALPFRTWNRKGYAKEALLAVSCHSYSIKKGIHRVTEIVDAENQASIRLLKSTGFRQKAILSRIYFQRESGKRISICHAETQWDEHKNQQA